ncbi:cyclic pyranopterin monophosphate synthase MoaC [Dehalococcoidales bacterium]|nr:cyclic pyranopterin monophosphate synthase MoaC [Dehalococcoidales bacterium]
MIEIYSDGAYNSVLGQGGWGAVIVENGQKRVFSGIVKRTTSNRMEITAALEGILRTPQGSEVIIYTDSQYLFGCMSRGWQRRANRDLWQRLDEVVSQRRVRWQWIERSAKNPFQKEAHALATNLASQDKMVRPVPSEPKVPMAMVDITQKPDTEREAVAKGRVRMMASTLDRLKAGKMPKGDVLAAAQLAGIMAAKQTPHIIPLCHPVLIGDIKVEFNLDEENNTVEITTTVKSIGKTGVEMEALTATAVTALTIYDMCKVIDQGIQIESIRLIRKSGGKSGVVNLE